MKTFLLTLSIIVSQICFGQTLKYKAVSAGISKKIDGDFKFPNYQNDNTVVVLNTKTSALTLYGKDERTYDIYTTRQRMTLSNGDEIMEFYAIDPEGKKCILRQIILDESSIHSNYTNQLYIIYDNYQIVFNLI